MKIKNKIKKFKYIIIKKQKFHKIKIKSRKKPKYKYIKKIFLFLLFALIIILLTKTLKHNFFLFPKFFSKQKQKEHTNITLYKTKIINDYLFSIPQKYENYKKLEKSRLENYFSLKNLPKNSNDSTTQQIKSKLLSQINQHTRGKDFSKVNSVFLTYPINFGNTMVMVNNIMYYSEVFGIKNIYFHKRYNWYINNNITTEKFNISVISSNNINCKARDTVCFSLNDVLLFFFLYSPELIKPKIRINLLKDEIRRNLPYVDIDQNDLIIHIRSGAIFRYDFNQFYSQPPLCFYQKIVHNFKFKNIIIVAENNNNPVIHYLIKEFPNIIYKKNSLGRDISYLSNAYNLVGSISSFSTTVIKFNDNLKNYWDYDLYRKSEKFCHLHHEYFDFNKKFTTYRMIPSDNYKNEMFVWSNDPLKIKLMIEEKCNNNFKKIKPEEWE